MTIALKHSIWSILYYYKSNYLWIRKALWKPNPHFGLSNKFFVWHPNLSEKVISKTFNLLVKNIGWQHHAIECILKRALLPQNLLAVRKIAIRLFLLWYQTLAVYNNTNSELDSVFQSLLPYFPLTEGRNTEKIIQDYCEGAHVLLNGAVHNGGPGPSKPLPIILNNAQNGPIGTRERAQTLQAG